jgi:SPX domain protein involved in polyphosphate accumulation
MSCRLDYLVESVSTDSFIGKKKRKNWRKEMRMRMSTLVQHQFIDTNVDIEGIDDSDDDFEDLTESQRQVAKNEAHQVMKETDSVRRAMIDLHRRSKMLANFQIMNSTGFIKIIKKFDKSFPQKKGSLKEVLTDGFVCNDGKCVHALSERMVSDERKCVYP